MVLNHLAAILFFAGPLFYFGLWIAIDPAGLTSVLELLVHQPERKIRTAVRFAGVVLVLLAVAI